MNNKMIIAFSAVALMLTACASGGTQADNKQGGTQTDLAQVVNTPAEISFYMWSMSQSEFDYIAQQAKSKFPNYTLKAVPSTGTGGVTIDTLVASGEMPDLFVGRGVATPDLQRTGLLYDVSELVKKYNFDTSRIDPMAFEMMKNETGGIIAGIPLSGTSGGMMHYNKDLFDKFGVPYPKDGMTWDEVYELAKLMTRAEGGIQYRGFSDRWMETFFTQNPFGEPILSLKEDKAAVNTETWKKIGENWKRFYTLPGLKFDSTTINKDVDWKEFINGHSAMTTFASRNFMDWDFKWDIVSMPTYKELPGIGRLSDFRNIYITSSSKNKDAAFQVAAWLASDDMQAKLAADLAVFPVLKNDEIKKMFMKNDPMYKDKNIKAASFNKVGPAMPGRKPGLTNVKAENMFMKELQKAIVESKDLNTVLRSAEEVINKAIAAEKAK
ncbi:ABC transporter substrate-binding protein [Paenibacillus sp. UNC451MF]|uniref:ABC transporter substrate-binding protein n=1 Tax=Paenibacillus sp. UNC451MF TaxID=1449063 RepID=UPI00068D6517|nr:extracellular solute-binding protein [Paenibacillus sp. UNC451MF]